MNNLRGKMLVKLGLESFERKLKETQEQAKSDGVVNPKDCYGAEGEPNDSFGRECFPDLNETSAEQINENFNRRAEECADQEKRDDGLIFNNYHEVDVQLNKSSEPNLAEPYQSSGSDYVPDSEDTNSAEKVDSQCTMEDKENMEIDSNAKENEGRKKRGRKRKTPNQSRQERKKFANSNIRYVSARNKIIEPKKFNTEYSCTCSRKCHTIVDIEIRKRLFDQFWTIGTFEGRCAILSKCVKEIDKKRCYTKSKISRRSKSRMYYMNDYQVCKDALLSTLQINQNQI